MDKNIIALSGLPRSGSSLLLSILSQNNNFYVEGTSGLCQILYDLNISFEESANQVLTACGNMYKKDRIMKSVVENYYLEANNKIIIDKGRNWTINANLDIFKKYVNDKPKLIVTVRPIKEIIESLVFLNYKNSIPIDQDRYEDSLFEEHSSLIFDPLAGIFDVVKRDDAEVLFVRYSDLVTDPQSIIKQVYSFLDLEEFNHDLFNIEKTWHEDDSVYNILGLHDVRPQVDKIVYNIELSDKTLERCVILDVMLEETINGFICSSR